MANPVCGGSSQRVPEHVANPPPPFMTTDPETNNLFAQLEYLDPSHPGNFDAYLQGFKALAQETVKAIEERKNKASSDLERGFYEPMPYNELVDLYDNIPAFAGNIAIYSGGYISGSVMPYDGCVAMQGVTEQNAPRVAQFLFEHKIPLIVRLTAHWQDGIEKSLDWIQHSSQWGDFQCTVEKVCTPIILDKVGEIDASMTETHFTLTNQEGAHKMIELFVQNWADGGAISAASVIAAIRVLRGELNLLTDKVGMFPFVVHCSAGVDRTGLFLTAKKIMEEFDAGRDPDIPRILLDLRLARNENVVMTAERFALCYAVKKEYRKQLRHAGDARWKA